MNQHTPDQKRHHAQAEQMIKVMVNVNHMLRHAAMDSLAALFTKLYAGTDVQSVAYSLPLELPNLPSGTYMEISVLNNPINGETYTVAKLRMDTANTTGATDEIRELAIWPWFRAYSAELEAFPTDALTVSIDAETKKLFMHFGAEWSVGTVAD